MKNNFSEKEFLDAIRNSTSHVEAARKLGYNLGKRSKPATDTRYYKFYKKLQPDTKHFINRHSNTFSEEIFVKVISESKNHSEAIKKLGYKTKTVLKNSLYQKYLIKLKPDISHFCLLSKSSVKNKQSDIDIESYYNYFKSKAVKRNKEFNLSLSEFKTIVTLPCNYCGRFLPIKRDKRCKYANKVSGIDRLDSNKGYIKNNVVPCCTRCNQSKNDMTLEEFYKHIESIYNFLKSQNKL